MENSLSMLLHLLLTNPLDAVRLCGVEGLDERYNVLLRQLHHLPLLLLLLLLQDKAVAVRAVAL